jgi:hypothetical protein
LCFSDSFLLFTADDSALSFSALDSFVRQFIVSLVLHEIPVRGAMSYGYLYADAENSLYFGQALVESASVGEAQDWVGFALCKTVVDQLDVVGLSANKHLNYASWPIPFKLQQKDQCRGPIDLPAFIIGAGPSEQGQKNCRNALSTMRNGTPPEVQRKYENTLAFLVGNVRNSSA